MKYELMLILDPTKSEKELQKSLKEIKSSVEEHGFEIKEEDSWGMRDLAYKIKGCTKGTYIVMTFKGEGTGMEALRKDLHIQPGLLRSMLIKVPNDYVLLTYEQIKMSSAKKLSKPAEELQEKVTGKKKAAVSPEPEINLDEKLKAIAEDADISL